MPAPRSFVSQLTLADLPNAVPWARRHTADVLRRWQVPSEVIQTARLVVSELAAGAVRQEEPEASQSVFSADALVGTFTVLLQLSSTSLFIQVSDRDPKAPTARMEASSGNRSPAQGQLFLVDAMSHQWGYYHPRSRPGKVTWVELRLDAARFRREKNLAEDPRGADALLIGRVLAGLREMC